MGKGRRKKGQRRRQANQQDHPAWPGRVTGQARQAKRQDQVAPPAAQHSRQTQQVRKNAQKDQSNGNKQQRWPQQQQRVSHPGRVATRQPPGKRATVRQLPIHQRPQRQQEKVQVEALPASALPRPGQLLLPGQHTVPRPPAPRSQSNRQHQRQPGKQRRQQRQVPGKARQAGRQTTTRPPAQQQAGQRRPQRHRHHQGQEQPLQRKNPRNLPPGKTPVHQRGQLTPRLVQPKGANHGHRVQHKQHRLHRQQKDRHLRRGQVNKKIVNQRHQASLNAHAPPARL